MTGKAYIRRPTDPQLCLGLRRYGHHCEEVCRHTAAIPVGADVEMTGRQSEAQYHGQLGGDDSRDLTEVLQRRFLGRVA